MCEITSSRRLRVPALFLLAISASSCGFLSDEGYDAEVRTDKQAYIPTPGGGITLTVTNRSSGSLYFVCTGLVDLQQLEGGRITQSWYVSGAEQCGVVTLEAGESAVREYPFDKESNLLSIPDAKYDRSVRYRFRFQLFKDRDGRTRPIDEHLQYSNEFSMVKAAMLAVPAPNRTPDRLGSRKPSGDGERSRPVKSRPSNGEKYGGNSSVRSKDDSPPSRG